VPDADRQTGRTTGAAKGAEAAKGADATRKQDHAGIARLTEELLPALIAKLGTTHLGELEVTEGEWHVRLRRPFGTAPGEGRRVTDKPSRSQPGHEGHGHGRAAPEGTRGSKAGAGGSAASRSGPTNGTGARADLERSRTIATSPAVGIFQPGSRAVSGTRVRAGDSLGAVNVLGVPQDVLAPVDGIVGATLVEEGTAVEYGQELIRIELAVSAETL
jgi:biotin carboxyl carrier protein